jgi:hypothetical protein
METGYIKIISEEGNAPSIEAQLVNNTLWMDKYLIAKMFNCCPQKVEANLRSIPCENTFKRRISRNSTK